ncbi:unnamed protein product [Dracunculus medinensis]|uniref:Bestrophin homolog n=1 Tax=Dracunculus medinensis TaxID=318479 RepID=A0A0N4U1F8_DRAME|nr:unnamed protein product [Dracunculus medinensis]
MTLVQFVFYVGWMKAAEVLLNPLGEDDDDFEGNFLIDKNLATALCVVDDCRDDVPDIKADQFWKTGQVDQIYSQISVNDEIHPLVGSAVNARLDF